jgi:hypothetical protein
MKQYTFYYDYEQDSIISEDAINSSTELEIKYSVKEGSVMIQSVKINTYGESQIDIVPILDVINHKELNRLAESDVMRRNVEQMYKNYSHLSMPMTTEQKSELLKLK